MGLSVKKNYLDSNPVIWRSFIFRSLWILNVQNRYYDRSKSKFAQTSGDENTLNFEIWCYENPKWNNLHITGWNLNNFLDEINHKPLILNHK